MKEHKWESKHGAFTMTVETVTGKSQTADDAWKAAIRMLAQGATEAQCEYMLKTFGYEDE